MNQFKEGDIISFPSAEEMKTMIYSARVPEIKEVRCNDIFEFMDLPNEIVVDGFIFTRSNNYNMDGTTFVVYYQRYQ